MFYISSRGSSANTWLAKIISKHPKIVCFRSSRSFPPVNPGVKKLGNKYKLDEVSPDFFIEGLLECERATENQKIFGSIHGYHGILAKKACEDNGGVFAYVTRHPIDRMHSALIYYLDNYFYKNAIANKDIHNRICEIFASRKIIHDIKLLDEKNAEIGSENKNIAKVFLKNLLPKSFKDNFRKLNLNFFSSNKKNQSQIFSKSISESLEVRYIYNLMSGLLDSFFVFEKDLIKNCNNKQGIKMEEMVSSPNYLKHNVFKLLTPSITLDDKLISEIFKEKRHGVHRHNPISTIDIWDSWPNSLKELFLKKFYHYEINLVTSQWDYDISFI